MKKSIAFCLSLIAVSVTLSAQVKSPAEFLGYELGSHFTPHYKVADYFRQTALASPKNIKLIEYGKPTKVGH